MVSIVAGSIFAEFIVTERIVQKSTVVRSIFEGFIVARFIVPGSNVAG